MAQLINVKLSRFDSSPWGFRLQGGKDFGAPLLIQKVNGGSLAEKAGLLAGDAVIKVNDVEVFNLRHKEAQDAIVRAGNSFAVTVQRGGSTWKPQVTPVGPTPTINSSPTANIQPVTKTSLAAKQPAAKPIGTGHNLAAKPFGAPQVNGEPMVKSIVNKQYNTPVGMYSEESIAETLSAQAEVLAGGVLGVNFMKNEKNYNAANSEVFKMVQEIDSEPRESEPAVLSRSPESSEPPVGAAPVVSPPVTGLRHVSAPETRPTPTTPHEDPFKILPPGQNICADCERLIVGVFVRIKDKNLHVECFKCATCGTSLKNVGYYNINNKLYCDVHAKLVARQHPPAPNLEPITIPPGGKAPAGTISAALSSVTAPGPRPVPGPTSAPAPSLAPAPRSVPAPRSAPAPVSPSSPQTIGPMPFHPVGRPQISENGFVTENNLKNILTAIPALAIDDTDSGTVHPTVPSSIMSKQYKAPRIGTSHVNAPGSLQSPNIISAPKPFSVPTAPTTSPARPAPATSNKLVWPPHKEEEIPSSLLATAIPLYIPPTPSHQPKKSAIFAVPAQSSQNQFIGSQQNQTTPEHTQQQTASEKYLVKQDPVHLPSTQAKIQPLPSVPQPHSNAVSQVKETSLEEQQFSQQETETISLTSSSQENSTLKVQRDLIQEQQPESLVASGKETESVVKIIQSEGEIRTSSINSEGEVKSTTINSEGKVKTASVTSEGEVKTTSVTSESEVKTTSVNSEEVSLITQAEKTETSVEQIAELQTTVVQTSDSQEEQKPPSPPPPNDEILPQLTQETEKIQQTCEKIENVEVSAVEEVQIESLSIVEQSKVDTPISESSMMTEPAASDVSQSQVPSMSMEPIAAEVPSVSESEPQVVDSSLQTEAKPIVQPEPQLSEIPSLSNETATVQKQQASDPQPQSGNPGGSSINIQSQSTYTNKGLSYRQVPAGGFRPISSEFQTSICQEVSQYTSVESFSKTTNTIQSSSNTGPISFPAQTPAHNPRNQSTPSDNPSRSEACSSPMISALTIAPDRPYCLVPSAMKPQAPTQVQSFIPSSQSEASTHVQSFIPSSQFAGTKSHTALSNQVPPSTNMPGLGDETQLPVLPPSSQHMSMVQALTIAPDRPYSPFLSSAQTPNTVVQSEASAFTAVSPQTVNTRPKMTVPQQSTVVSHIESGPQSYAVKPLPTSTVKRMAAKPASPRPVSRSSLPVMGAFRPTVPTGDLRPPNLDERWQLDSQQFETDTALSNTIQTRGMPNMTQVSLIDNTGGQVVVQRTRHVEESSTVSHREMQKTIQRSGHVSSVISSQELSNLSSTHSTLKETAVGSHQQLTNPVFTQQEKQQQQYQEAKHSSFGTHKPSAIPFYQQDIERFQIQRALSPAPHSPHIRAISPVTTQKPIFPASPSQVEKKDLPPQHPSQKQEVQTGSQPKPPTVPMVSQYRRQQYQKQQHEQKLYSLSDVQKPAVIPFYQQDIAGYQKQRAISPAPHSQQVQRAISPASQQKSTPIHYPPTAPMQQPVSQTPSKPATLPQQKPPVPAPAGPSEVQTFPQQQPLPSTQTVQNEPQQNTFTQTPAVPGSVPTLSQQQPLPPTPTIQNLPQQKNLTQTPAIPTQTPFSLPFPNIPLPEGMSVETLMMKNTQLSTKSSILASQPQPSQVVPPAPQASKSLPTAQPSPVTQSSTSAFKPQSPQKLPTEPQQTTPSVATQPSSVTKIPIPPTSSSIPNAGGGIGGGAGGGPTGQKGSASFAGSSAPRRGRGVLNQQAPGARIPLCGHCNNQIRGPFITALGRIWCPEHFICVNAQCRRQLQDIGFVEEKGDLYCEFCFEQYIAPTCSKCSKKVKGDCLNAIGKQFHPECFLCAYCGKLFGNNPFYLEDGLPYCETDWNELFTTKCFACGFPIEAGDRWVEALNNNYHSQCFNCTSCKKNLEGQNFYAKGGRPFCKAHAR